MAERERILNALLELDFDKQLSKVPEEIYVAQREKLVQQGAKVLEELDQLVDGIVIDVGAAGDELEAMIAARKAERT